MKKKHKKSATSCQNQSNFIYYRTVLLRQGEREDKKYILEHSYRFSEHHIMFYKATSTIFKLLDSNEELLSDELQKQHSDNELS